MKKKISECLSMLVYSHLALITANAWAPQVCIKPEDYFIQHDFRIILRVFWYLVEAHLTSVYTKNSHEMSQICLISDLEIVLNALYFLYILHHNVSLFKIFKTSWILPGLIIIFLLDF